jgi:hypothetical protein
MAQRQEAQAMSTYYLRLEGVNLDHFVFDTNSLSVVRGGGLLLLDATDRVGNAGLGLTPVTTGASAGLFAFEANDDGEAACKRRAVDAFLKGDAQLRHATFVVDVVPASERFAADREKLLALNRWRQMQAPSVAPPKQPTPDHGPCRIDGVRPAGNRGIPKGPDTRAASDSVHARWTHGVGQKQAFYQQRAQADPKLRLVADFETLTDDPGRGNLHRKMAVIYADGNGFGKLQADNCQTREAQEQFDTDIKGLRAELLRALVAEAAKNPAFQTAKGEIRLETLLWGGERWSSSSNTPAGSSSRPTSPTPRGWSSATTARPSTASRAWPRRWPRSSRRVRAGAGRTASRTRCSNPSTTWGGTSRPSAANAGRGPTSWW